MSIEVVPIERITGTGRYYLVLFERSAAAPPAALAVEPSELAAELPAEEQAPALRRSLAEAREYLRSITEEHEVKSEELRAANEEIRSANEELQSTNAELAGAKQELQSTNEELNVLNEELQGRNQALSAANDDLRNLLVAVDTPVLMTGSDLRLRRYTPASERLLNLHRSDIGRPVCDVLQQLNVPDLEKLLHQVIDMFTARRSRNQTLTAFPIS
ncbi:MAG: PAS domain-containing protein [Bryobacteraceae bacterium]